jgi:hypothetical protein
MHSAAHSRLGPLSSLLGRGCGRLTLQLVVVLFVSVPFCTVSGTMSQLLCERKPNLSKNVAAKRKKNEKRNEKLTLGMTWRQRL